jgi:hypothetical protein
MTSVSYLFCSVSSPFVVDARARILPPIFDSTDKANQKHQARFGEGSAVVRR